MMSPCSAGACQRRKRLSVPSSEARQLSHTEAGSVLLQDDGVITVAGLVFGACLIVDQPIADAVN